MREVYSPEEEGIWVVRGEDPNADLGGSHVMPLLGYFQGKYKHVLALAETLNGWSAWGTGGKVEKLNVKSVDEFTPSKRAELLEKRNYLEKQLADVDKELE